MKRIYTQFALIFLVVFSLLATGCPQKSIDTAKKSSAKVATYANTGVNITRDLYREKLISLETKDKIADGFIALARAGQAFDAAVLKIEAQYGSTAPPKAELDRLFAVFDDEVIGELVDLLRTITRSGIPDKFREVVDTIKSAVIVVAKTFGHSAVVKQKLAEVS